MYNSVVMLHLPVEVMMTGSADDLTIVVLAKEPDDVKVYANETISAVTGDV